MQEVYLVYVTFHPPSLYYVIALQPSRSSSSILLPRIALPHCTPNSQTTELGLDADTSLRVSPQTPMSKPTSTQRPSTATSTPVLTNQSQAMDVSLHCHLQGQDIYGCVSLNDRYTHC
ncbi:hypothetical protein BJ508DRAFT_13902 [Ascobolus immersus RN42]|uniref:Uncharacterized protein n=1 Tax=Ascobolus immersus RN42 TaxID=1160509 RepID=A0A3N4IUA6_ASCIM|nr:hypothetical protein BJ508DRAFT_13902 [Ascobolus immersus RN42]